MLNQNSIPQNSIDLKDLLDLHDKGVNLSLNCHAVGIVKSFSALKQTANVQIAYKRSFLERDPDGTYSLKSKDYPLVIDCPVIFLGNKTAGLTIPVEVGDECLLLFNDRDIDNWYTGNQGAPVNTPRLHSLTDGFALVGVRSRPQMITDFNTDGAELFYKGNKIIITEDDITLNLPDGQTVLKVTKTGKFSVTNLTGEFVSALIQTLQTATAGGYPLLADLSVLSTFME